MTITQLQYLVALDDFRHFALAANHCCVTQPTLSMQIQKLEEKLGTKIFDRNKQPVIPTEIGLLVLAQARIVLREAGLIEQLVSNEKKILAGDLRIGIIPTLAPYLLPPLFKLIQKKYPQINLIVKETITEEVIRELKFNRLDCGLVVTPLKDNAIQEDPLFYEEILAYVSKKNNLHQKKYVLPSEIDPQQLWLLEEGHCFRSQVLNICELQNKINPRIKYKTGNIETLKRMVDISDGITLLPELAVKEFSKTQMKQVRQFKEPRPAREVSLVSHRNLLKPALMEILKNEVLSVIPLTMQNPTQKRIIDLFE